MENTSSRTLSLAIPRAYNETSEKREIVLEILSRENLEEEVLDQIADSYYWLDGPIKKDDPNSRDLWKDMDNIGVKIITHEIANEYHINSVMDRITGEKLKKLR